jgi:hypothetical protein
MIKEMMSARMGEEAGKRLRRGRTRRSFRIGPMYHHEPLTLWKRLRSLLLGRPARGFSDKDFWRP